jgi:hypothetical protein
MKHLFKTLLIFYFSPFLIGCECYPARKGVIFDEATQMPIENVQIEFGNSKTLSNANGQFEISAKGCDLKITITKDSYKTFGAYLSNKNIKQPSRLTIK